MPTAHSARLALREAAVRGVGARLTQQSKDAGWHCPGSDQRGSRAPALQQLATVKHLALALALRPYHSCRDVQCKAAATGGLFSPVKGRCFSHALVFGGTLNNALFVFYSQDCMLKLGGEACMQKVINAFLTDLNVSALPCVGRLARRRLRPDRRTVCIASGTLPRCGAAHPRLAHLAADGAGT